MIIVFSGYSPNIPTKSLKNLSIDHLDAALHIGLWTSASPNGNIIHYRMLITKNDGTVEAKYPTKTTNRKNKSVTTKK
ncbi:MAG: hypothetical protein EAZ44_08355 [Cytophagia bacterium]|nr:MAG: hypothetical protein EAZ44_08355 [Cytophagia bacterium]TAG39163.1 MAG: hypothetical protein EAZ31_09550 [Cytophagia bacterium]